MEGLERFRIEALDAFESVKGPRVLQSLVGHDPTTRRG